jgi:hypothetical protein
MPIYAVWFWRHKKISQQICMTCMTLSFGHWQANCVHKTSLCLDFLNRITFNSAECFVLKYSSCLFIPTHFEENGSCEGAIQDWRVKRGFQDWTETLSLPMEPKQRTISNMSNCWVDMSFTLLLIPPYCRSTSYFIWITRLDLSK